MALALNHRAVKQPFAKEDENELVNMCINPFNTGKIEKSINLRIIGTLIECSLKQKMFTFIVFEILSILRPAQRVPGSKRFTRQPAKFIKLRNVFTSNVQLITTCELLVYRVYQASTFKLQKYQHV